MYRSHLGSNAQYRQLATVRWSSSIVLVGAALGLFGCATSEGDSTATAETQQDCRKPIDPTPYSCGYKIESQYVSRWLRDGYLGAIQLTNVSGDPATEFELFADLGGAKVERSVLAENKPVEGGYLFSAPRSLERRGIRQGHSHEILFMSRDDYAGLTPYLLSVNGVQCDPTPPTVTLDSSGKLFTSSATLTLTATAADNVAVKKVVFLRDGVEIASDAIAPYVLEIPLTSALNGRDRYTAVAYDMSGNITTSNAKSVLTAIGNKFFGTASEGAADNANLLTYFNQLTPGNAGKWGSVEATRDQMNWAALDEAYGFAQANGIPFKLHTLIWGQQQPAWLSALTPAEQLVEIEQWMAALSARYPNVALVDVVNEPLHAVPAYSPALGGPGATGWDWVVKAFEMARVYFPNAELLVNDYNVEAMDSWATDYLNVINVLNTRGLVDGIGLQAHFLERAELPVIATNLDRFAATGLPIYVSELDVNFANDSRQAQRMRDLFTMFWNHPSVLGVTHWGYRQGAMWRTDAYLTRTDLTQRPAMQWINCFRAGGTSCTVPDYVATPRNGDLTKIMLEAEDYDSAQGLMAAGNSVAYTDNGDWLSFDRVVFNSNWDSLAVTYAKGSTDATSNITVHLGSLESAPIATIPLPSTGGWGVSKTITLPWAPISGERNVYVRFNGGYGIANLDSIKFSAPTGVGSNVIADGDFEASTNGFSTWATGTIATTTTRQLSGASSLMMSGRTGNSPLLKSLTSLLVPGKTYKVDLWATVGGAASAAHITKKIQCKNGSASYTWLGGEQTLTDGTWSEFSGDLVVPDCELADVAFYLEGPGAGVDLYMDHVSVRAVTAANLVNNGTFESGVSGWYTWNGGTLQSTTTRFHSGAKALVVTNRTANAPAAIDLSAVAKSGASFPMSIWVSIDSPDSTSKKINVTSKTVCTAADGTATTAYNWVGSQVTVPDDGSWAEIKGTLSLPSCNLTQLQLFVEGDAGADLYVDDVSITDPALSNILPDGTFENGIGAWGTWGGATLTTTTTLSHSGTQAAVLTNRASNAPIARTLTTLVTPGKSYQVVFWASIDSPDNASANVNITSMTQCSGASATYAWMVNPVTIADRTWAKLAGTLVVPNCTLANVMVYAEGPAAGIDLYIDDVSLSPL